jgi:hypothetical protein
MDRRGRRGSMSKKYPWKCKKNRQKTMKTQSLPLIYSAQAHSNQKRAMDIMTKRFPSPISTSHKLSASRLSYQHLPSSPPTSHLRRPNISRKLSSQVPPCKIGEVYSIQAITTPSNSRNPQLLMMPTSPTLIMASIHKPQTRCPCSTSASVRMASPLSTFSSSSRPIPCTQQCSLRLTLCPTLSARRELLQTWMQNRIRHHHSKKRKKRISLLSS